MVGAATMSLAIYGARYRFTTATNDPDLSSLDHILNIYRAVLIFERVDFDIFTRLVTVTTVKQFCV